MAEIAVWLMPAPAEVSDLSLFSSRSLVSGGPAEVVSLGLLPWWSIPCAYWGGGSLGPALEEGDFFRPSPADVCPWLRTASTEVSG